MCTVSWSFSREGYDLFFNRDELNTRAPEFPPALLRRGEVTFLAPRDGDHGGTWLFANEFGLTVCLLNDYANPWRPAGPAPHHSRGHLVMACATAANLAEVFTAVQAQPLARTMPFRLVALAPGEQPLLLHWTGATLISGGQRNLLPPLTSSSYATSEVIALRTWRFAYFVRSATEPEPEELAIYHRQHFPGFGPDSVLMHRPDAATRSIIHVRVDAGRVSISYEPVRWVASGPVLLEAVESALPRRTSAPRAA